MTGIKETAEQLQSVGNAYAIRASMRLESATQTMNKRTKVKYLEKALSEVESLMKFNKEASLHFYPIVERHLIEANK